MANIGCFGSVICHDSESDTCKACPQVSLCGELVGKNFKEISDSLTDKGKKAKTKAVKKQISSGTITEFSQADLKKAGERIALTKYEMAAIAKTATKKRIKRHLASLKRKGISGSYVRNVLVSGKNPFQEEKPELLKLACENMLTNNLTLNKTQLVETHERKGKQRKTALAQADTAINVLQELNVINKYLNFTGV
jgi:hypothetical protein